MKFIFALALLATTALAVPATDATNADLTETATLTVDEGCYWSGTAPFCAGSCPEGYHEINRGSCGDGACCWTGYKVHCCKD